MEDFLTIDLAAPDISLISRNILPGFEKLIPRPSSNWLRRRNFYMSELTRTVPVAVRRQLRTEVGFGCPVDNCGSPYLEYHHFDPEWHVKKHHNPEGMIAICAMHHGLANAWTVDQTKELKKKRLLEDIGENFHWMREEMIAVVGGNYYYETLVIFEYKDKPVVWFTRNSRKELLLNVSLSDISGVPRFEMRDNDWIARGNPCDIECGPGGKLLQIKYDDGDFLRIQFKEWVSGEKLVRAHPATRERHDNVEFPVVTVEVTLCVKSASVSFGPRKSQIGGISFINCWFERMKYGLSIGGTSKSGGSGVLIL